MTERINPIDLLVKHTEERLAQLKEDVRINTARQEEVNSILYMLRTEQEKKDT